AWQAQAAFENRSTAFAAPNTTPGKNRLHVQWLPHRACLDVVRLQTEPHVFARGAELRRFDCDAGQPVVSAAVLLPRHELDPGHRTKFAAIEFEIPPPRSDPFRQHAQLSAPDGGEHVAHAVIESEA